MGDDKVYQRQACGPVSCFLAITPGHAQYAVELLTFLGPDADRRHFAIEVTYRDTTTVSDLPCYTMREPL